MARCFMMKHFAHSFLLVTSLVFSAACGDDAKSSPDTSAPVDTSDTIAEETIVAPDIVEDVAIDLIEEVTPDVAPDVAPDVTPDVASDIMEDVVPDVAPDVVVAPCDGDPCAAVPDTTCIVDGADYACACANGRVLNGVEACADVVDVSIAPLAVCALQRDGGLACWGENSYFMPVPGGEVGEVRRPVAVAGVWDQVSLGGAVSCGLQQGALYCWGQSATVFGDAELRTEPARMDTFDDWSLIRLENATICGLRAGKAYCWGNNTSGQLGVGDKAPRSQPTEVVGGLSGWTALVTINGGTCGLASGAIYCWGNVLGASLTVPTRFGVRSDWTALVAGSGHCCALGAGEVACMGYNFGGALGNGTTTSQATFEREQSATAWSSVIAGGGTTCARRADSGALACWGNLYLGDGANATLTTTATAAPTLDAFAPLFLGDQLACGVTQGRLSCWGETTSARLGDGTPGYMDQPAAFPAPAGTSGWSQLDAGSLVGCGIAGGGLYCWGDSVRGKLGLGATTAVWSPTRVGVASDWNAIDVGGNEVCGLRQGVRYCWGWNRSGGVGDGTLDMRTTPVALGPDSDWTKLVMGAACGCGLRAGALYCWGDRALVYLDDGPTVSTPTRVGTATNWSDVAVGKGAACGIRAGQLYCWGNGFSLILPDGAVPPTRVGNLSTWSDINIGGDNACGLAAGRLYCWGSGSWGQIGDGTRQDSSTPLAVGADNDWTSVSLGSQGAAAIKGGQLYTWGYNFGGGLVSVPNAAIGTQGLTSVTTGYVNAFVRGPAGAAVYGTNGVAAGVGNHYLPSIVTLP